MTTLPLLLEETNLSSAWLKVLGHIIEDPKKEISPLILTLTEFEESTKIREVLESSLKAAGLASIETVSETIFPNSLYHYFDYDRKRLYDGYLDILPRIRKVNSKNRNGTYFGRLIAFDKKINQLEIIITSYLAARQDNRGVRRSKLQASIFDPRVDHTNSPYQGFPCLQHVTFSVTQGNGLVLNSFYAVQYLFERAYGNWLGLINLGRFMASEMGLNFERFNCYVGVEQLDHLTKASAEQLLELTN